MDKGLATNPALGTGLVAGFRTSGNSERPGFAWFFGRDALWTSLATTASGGFDTARTALDVPAPRYQREDGKIPHEISQAPRSCRGSPNFRMHGRAPMRRLSTSSPTPISGAPPAIARISSSPGRPSSRPTPSPRQPTPTATASSTTRRRARLGGRRRALSAARGDLPAGAVDRGVAQLCRDGRRDAGRAGRSARARCRRTDARGGRVHLLAGGQLVLCVRDGPAAHVAAGGGARAGARAAAAAPERDGERDARRRRHRAARGPDVVAHARSRARRRRARSPRQRRDGHRLGHTASCPNGASCTIRCRITTDRSGRSSPAGRRWRPTGTAVRTSATRR